MHFYLSIDESVVRRCHGMQIRASAENFPGGDQRKKTEN